MAISGCRPKNPPPSEAKLPAIPTSHPVERVVTDYVDFTGRTNAVDSVDIRARVSGYLVQMLSQNLEKTQAEAKPENETKQGTEIKEGAEVKKGDLLFVVDPRPYQAQYDQAQGQVNLYAAQLDLAAANYRRDLKVDETPGAISKQQLDQDKASVKEAAEAVKAFQASLEIYNLNLKFTKVTSPIDGQVSRNFMTLGNLVVQDQTLLTTVVSLDPMYVYCDVDEGTILRVRRAINEGTIKRYQEGEIPIWMALQGEAGFPHRGTVNFINNQVNPNTGSISVRGVFANPKPENGVRLFSPGMFVRVRLPIGQPHPAILVIDRAIGSDQGLKFVYVVDGEGNIEQRRVSTGALQEDGLRVITAGLKSDEWIVVGAMQQVRPKAKIKPDRMPMPTLGESVKSEMPAEKPAQASPAKNSQPRK
jgi:membrane fusion protein, multidrug efflux system